MIPSLSPPARPGFWWSPVDPVAILAIGAATALLLPRIGPLAGLLPVVLGHYLLFCNVVRLRPWREALWAASFLWICGLFAACQIHHWLPVTLVILPITAILVVEEIRSPGYRGIGARTS